MTKMARINIELDDTLVEKAMRMSGARTKKELVDKALRFYRDILLKQQQEKSRSYENQH
jgi:Arc/MetJ family transcription regulator